MVSYEVPRVPTEPNYEAICQILLLPFLDYIDLSNIYALYMILTANNAKFVVNSLWCLVQNAKTFMFQLTAHAGFTKCVWSTI